LLALWQQDAAQLLERSSELRRVADAHDYPIWRALSMVLTGTAQIATGEPEEGMAAVERGTSLYAGLDTPPVFWPALLTIRAAGCVMTGRLAEAAAYLDEAQAALWEGDPEEADIEILRGDLLLAGTDPQPEAAAAAYGRAAEVARELGTHLSHLQALTRLAELRRGTVEEAEVLVELRERFEAFTEGFDSSPLEEARRVLDAAGPG